MAVVFYIVSFSEAREKRFDADAYKATAGIIGCSSADWSVVTRKLEERKRSLQIFAKTEQNPLLQNVVYTNKKALR